MIHHDAIATPEQVHANLNQWCILDCRFSLADPDEGERLFKEGHVPGAYHCHLNNDLSSEVDTHGGRHPLPDPDVWIHQLQSWGINSRSTVVVYDDNRLAFAARAWWLLRQAGVEQVKIMNGGFSAWSRAGFTVDRRTPRFKTVAKTTNLQWRAPPTVDYQHMNRLMGGVSPLIDSREPARFRGEQEPIDPVAGHIPGAHNLPWQDITDEQGLIKPLEFHQQRWQAYQGNVPVVYCGSGVTACVNLFSAYLADQEAQLYPGSWSDWCSYSDAPVATLCTEQA